MKSTIATKLRNYIPSSTSWQICLMLSAITPIMFVVNPARSQTIAQEVISANIQRPTLQVGSQGESVSELQAALKLLGFYPGEVDGSYNQSTASAVSKFQQAAGLNPDGIVGMSTWQKLFPNQQAEASTTQTTSVSSQTSNGNSSQTTIINSSQTSRTGTEPRPVRSQTNTATNTRPEPRPAKPQTNNTTPEPRPAKPQTNTATNTKPEPRPAKPQTNTATNTKPEPRPAKPNTTANTQKKPIQKQASSTQVRQSSRNTQSSRSQTNQTRQGSGIFGTSQNPSLQYTAQGLPILRYGTKGSEVVTLQNRLKKLGFLQGEVDGDFQEQTLTAVKAFQKYYGLEDDGVVGGASWQILLRR
jgi:peptidoglycan hydrolase-like protein with peptidoglycan-binding domain